MEESFDGMPADLREEIIRRCVRWEAPASRALLMQGQVSEACFCVTSGLVELSVTTEDGDIVVADVLAAGEWFGFSQLLASRASSLSASTLCATGLLVLRAAPLQDVLREYPEAQDWLRRLSLSQAERLVNRMAMYATQDTDARLQTLLEQHGEQIWSSKLTQRDLGRLVGCSRQRVNQALGRLRGRHSQTPRHSEAHPS